MTTFTELDKWLRRVSPFLVIRKVDAIVRENSVVDDEQVWVGRLQDDTAQQAALRIADQEVARIERLEDKLDRQQSIAALLIPVATALLTAAWFAASVWVAGTSFVALLFAGAALLVAARASVPFEHHTLTVPDLEALAGTDGDPGSAVAARAIVDSQRNIPYGIGVHNRVGAVRHALFTSLAFIVLSAVLFALPNWGSAGAQDIEARLDQRVQRIERELAAVVDDIDRMAEKKRTILRRLREIRREVRDLRR